MTTPYNNNNYGLTFSQQEKDTLTKIQKQDLPFGKTSLVNNAFRFNYKMIKYDNSWEFIFPECLCKEMVEEILSWCSVYDLRFLFPRLYIGLRLKLFRLPNHEIRCLPTRLERETSFHYKQTPLIKSVFNSANDLYNRSSMSSKDLVLYMLNNTYDNEGTTNTFLNKLYTLKFIMEEGEYTTYDKVLELIKRECEGYYWYETRRPYLEPLLNELPDFYKKEQDEFAKDMEKAPFLTKSGSLGGLSHYARSIHTELVYSGSDPISYRRYGRLHRILTRPDWNSRDEKKSHLRQIKRFIDDNQLRYYCRGVLKGTGFDAFPSSWTTKKFKTYLWKYQGLS